MSLYRTNQGIKRGIVILVLWTLILLGVLLTPIGEAWIPFPCGFKYWDKIAHFGLFAITGLIGMFSTNWRSQFKSRVLFATVFGLFLAVSTEFGQFLIPLRNTSLYDLLADLVGLCVGLALYAFLHSRDTLRSSLRL